MSEKAKVLSKSVAEACFARACWGSNCIFRWVTALSKSTIYNSSDIFISAYNYLASFTDGLPSLRYWVIHSVTILALFLSGWIFVATGIAADTLS